MRAQGPFGDIAVWQQSPNTLNHVQIDDLAKGWWLQ